ncbi:MAG: diguanylate cyclase domain-containing protein [Solirubrobacterales bacterium]
MENFYKTLLDHMRDGVYFVDPHRRITFWNKGAELITGFSAQEVVGRSCADNILVHVDDSGRNLCSGLCPLAASMETGRENAAKVYLHHKEGHRVPVQVRTAPIIDSNGQLIGGVETFNENQEIVLAIERIRELEGMAFFDKLTGLPNRRMIDQHLAARHEELVRNGWPFGVLMLDIDRFKGINDTYGHQVGDEVLKLVARTMLAVTRKYDLVARWGGEEFIAVLANVNREQLEAIGNKYRVLVEKSFAEINGSRIEVTISAGGVLARVDESIDSLIERADGALYNSKENGRNRVTIAE